MKFNDYLKTLVGPPKFAVVATTGLKEEDEIIALSYCGGEGAPKTIIRRILDQDKLLAAYDIHKFSPEVVRDSGMDDGQFMDIVRQDLAGPVFTYNPAFQESFLARIDPSGESPVRFVDLPLLWKGMNVYMELSPDITDVIKLQEAVKKFVGKAPGFTRLAKTLFLSQPYPAAYPCEGSCALLQGLFGVLDAELPVQETRDQPGLQARQAAR